MLLLTPKGDPLQATQSISKYKLHAIMSALLLTPGPVPIPVFVQEAMQKPVIHHRTAEFESFYRNMLVQLKYLFQTSGEVATMIGSGTYGVESAMYSLFEPGDTIAVLSMGKFSARWADYGRTLGCDVITLEKPWGETWMPEELSAALKDQDNLKGLVITHSETSTGTIVDLEAIATRIRSQHPDILIVVDGITSVGVMPYYHEAWGIDCTVTASQKALMNPAGLVLFAVSARAMRRMRPMDTGDFQHVGNYLAAANVNSFPFTAPVINLYGVEAALSRIKSEGLPAVWNRTHQSAKVFRRGLEALEGHPFSAYPTESLTAFRFDGKDMGKMKRELIEAGYELSGGQGSLKGKILRISHMAEADGDIMEEVLAAMKDIFYR